MAADTARLNLNPKAPGLFAERLHCVIVSGGRSAVTAVALGWTGMRVDAADPSPGHAGTAAVWRPAGDEHSQRFKPALARVARQTIPLHRQRAIGGHPAVLLRGVCRRRDPQSPPADPDGYVPFGMLVDYAAGRSDGCTSWSPGDAKRIMAMVSGNPATLYIYPESRDIEAVARAVAAKEAPSRAGLYWNAACLREIGAPRFLPKESLEPILARYREAHPAPPPQPTPICRGP